MLGTQKIVGATRCGWGLERTCAGQVRDLENPVDVYSQVVGMMTRMAEFGLIHCDLNEFNLLVSLVPAAGAPSDAPS